MDRHKIGVTEIAVVVRILFSSHAGGGIAHVVIAQCFLNDLFAAFDQIDLTVIFIFHRLCDKADGVHIFDLGTGTEFFAPFGTNGDIDITSHRPFLHLAVGNADIAHNKL